MAAPIHISVMLQEVVEALSVQPGGRYVDCTLGAGGHAQAIMERSAPGGQLLGIDADPEAIAIARDRLAAFGDAVLLVNNNFVNLQSICEKHDFSPVHGILLDLGLSSLQLEAEDRGFSFQHDAPLDMRFSPEQTLTAADIVNSYSEAELNNLIRTYGEEGFSRQIARRIVQSRPVNTTGQLARIIEETVGRRGRIHPATKTFQALRIAVNEELSHLESVLKQAVNLLGFGGRLVVISYHSLEDRIIKRFMQQESRDCVCPPSTPVCVCGHKASLKLVNKKVITPSLAEVQVNPRSRSAKMRVAERVISQEEHIQIVERLYLSAGNQSNGWRKPTSLDKLGSAFITA